MLRGGPATATPHSRWRWRRNRRHCAPFRELRRDLVDSEHFLLLRTESDICKLRVTCAHPSATSVS
jgi:hypothetical protein